VPFGRQGQDSSASQRRQPARLAWRERLGQAHAAAVAAGAESSSKHTAWVAPVPTGSTSRLAAALFRWDPGLSPSSPRVKEWGPRNPVLRTAAGIGAASAVGAATKAAAGAAISCAAESSLYINVCNICISINCSGSGCPVLGAASHSTAGRWRAR
jgi:hypothetical protein